MPHHSAYEVYQLIINSSYSEEFGPFISELRAAGAFSYDLTVLIDRLQTDEAFRKRLLREDMVDIHRRYHLPASEILALRLAATLLEPGAEWPEQGLSTNVAPSPYQLSKKYRNQSADFRHIRHTVIEPMIEIILRSEEDAKQVAVNPCLCLGTEDYNRAEFVFLTLFAALSSMKKRWWKRNFELGITPDFLTATNLSFDEAKHLAESLLDIVKTIEKK